MFAEMSGWTLYWIMRLDGIRDANIVIMYVAMFLVALALTIRLVVHVDRAEKGKASPENEALDRAARSVLLWVAPVAVASAMLVAFVPTTKQAAAIYVVPVIVNDEEVQGEAKDIYRLAKEFLREQVEGSGVPEGVNP